MTSMIFLALTFLFQSCSKDSGDNPEPELQDGKVSATLEFLDTKEKVEFSGTAKGVIGTGKQDTVLMTFSGKDQPMQFMVMITPAAEGTHRLGTGGFEVFGVFHQDTTKSTNYLSAYLVGADNLDDNESKMDGEASFSISSYSRDHIKGTFELTMIQNTTIKQDGEVLSGEIKTMKVTSGKLDIPLN